MEQLEKIVNIKSSPEIKENKKFFSIGRYGDILCNIRCQLNDNVKIQNSIQIKVVFEGNHPSLNSSEKELKYEQIGNELFIKFDMIPLISFRFHEIYFVISNDDDNQIILLYYDIIKLETDMRRKLVNTSIIDQNGLTYVPCSIITDKKIENEEYLLLKDLKLDEQIFTESVFN